MWPLEDNHWYQMRSSSAVVLPYLASGGRVGVLHKVECEAWASTGCASMTNAIRAELGAIDVEFSWVQRFYFTVNIV